MRLSFFTLLLVSFLHGEDLTYPYRDIHSPRFPLPEGMEVIVASPPRTGSTLVYNILQYLFEDRSCSFSDPLKRVKKVHNLQPFIRGKKELSNLYLFCTLRDPTEQFASLLRVGEVSCNPDINDWNREYKRYLKESIYFLRHFAKFPHFSFLFYENFAKGDFSPIFDKIEGVFSIKISEEERREIEELLSKKSLMVVADSMESFREVDPITGIHGKHISLEKSLSPITKRKQKEFEHRSKPLSLLMNQLKS